MSSLPRVLFVATRNNLSGASRSMLDLIRQLRRRGFDVSVALHQPGVLNDVLAKEGIEWIPLRTHRWIGRKRSGLQLVRNRIVDELTARRIAPLARSMGAALIHTNTLSSPVGGRIAAKSGLPHVWHMREAVDTEPGSVFLNGWNSSADFIASTATRVWCVSDFLSEATARYAPKDRIRTLYNGPLDPKEAQTPADRRPFGVEGGLRLLLVGAISERKGQREAIEGLAVLHRKGIDATLILAGEGRKANIERLQRRAEELGVGPSVEWLGQVDPRAHYGSVDIALVTGPLDPLPRTAIEALGNAIPTVALRSGGIPEIVDHGETGLLYDENTPEALADGVERMVGLSPDIRETMRLKGRRRAFARFNMDRYGADAIELYRELGLEPGTAQA